LAFALVSGAGALAVTHSDSRALPVALLSCAIAAMPFCRQPKTLVTLLAGATMLAWSLFCTADLWTSLLLSLTGSLGAVCGHTLGARIRGEASELIRNIFAIAFAQAGACLLFTEHAVDGNLVPLFFLYGLVPAILQVAHSRRLFLATFAAQPLVALALPMGFGYHYSYLLMAWFCLPLVALAGTAAAWYGRMLFRHDDGIHSPQRAPTSPAL
jgi:hypothetical protein